MSLELKILWFLASALIAPFVIAAGLAVGFAVLQVIDPILEGVAPPLAETLMLITGALALWLIWSAVRSMSRKSTT